MSTSTRDACSLRAKLMFMHILQREIVSRDTSEATIMHGSCVCRLDGLMLWVDKATLVTFLLDIFKLQEKIHVVAGLVTSFDLGSAHECICSVVRLNCCQKRGCHRHSVLSSVPWRFVHSPAPTCMP